MTSTVFTVKRNDRLPAPLIPLTNDDGTPVDLTDATSVVFRMRAGDAAQPKVDHAAVVVDPVNGKVRYDWQGGDTDTVGTYIASVVVTWPGAEPQTFPGKGFLLVEVEAGVSDAPVYGAVAPTGYVSVAALKAAPEAAGVNLSTLVPGKDAAAQAAALAQLIARASDAMDGWLSRSFRPRTATVVQTVRVNADYEGLLVPGDRPYVRCTAATAAAVPGGSAETVDAASVYADYLGPVPTLHVPLASNGGVGSRVRLSLTLETGYACTALDGAVSAAATQLVVKDPTGIVAGQRLRLADPGVEEFPLVGDAYVPGSTTVPVSALVFDHADGAPVSTVPGDLEQACILWTLGLLGARGGQEQEFPDAPVSPTARRGRAKRTAGSGFIARAQQLLRDGGYARALT